METLPNEHLEKLVKEISLMTHAMTERLPGFPAQLQKINGLLVARPELTHLLSDSQIRELMRGVLTESGIQYTIGKKGPGKVKLAGIDLDSLEL